MTQKLANEKITAKMPSTDDRPEIELLLCCVRTYIDTATAERIKNLLQEDIDWAYLIHTADNCKVMPLLYWSLNATCPEAVPNVTLDQLRNYFRCNTLRNIFLTKELLKLLNLFEFNGISALAFKGPVVAASVYGNLSLRQFSDLDILVHERDVPRVKNLLISQGYQVQLHLNWECHFVHEDSRVNVDLHQGIMPREWSFPLDFERLWGRLEPLSLAGTTVLNLLPEDLLLILCVQVARDCWQGYKPLAKICDIAELIHVHQAMNWGSVMEQAGMLSSERMFLLGLLLANELLGTALPEEILQRIQAAPVVQAFAMQVCSRLFPEVDSSPNELEKSLFYFRVRESLEDRIPYFLHWLYLAIAPSPADREFLPLPRSLSFLYYLVRPIRALSKYGLSPLKHRLGF